jgi:3-oxoacyl-[acyl-carrier protein] reductase
VAGEIIITGGQGTLGQALKDGLHERSRSPIHAPGREVLDVSSVESIEAFFKNRAVDLLICNAGIARDALLGRISESAWDEVLAVNLRGAAFCARAVARGMMRRKCGHILFISSHSALHPPAGQASYAASKAGLVGLGKSLARELGGFGIRVNVILPGFLESRMTRAVSEERRDQVLREHELGLFNTPEAVAKFVACLHWDLPHTSGQVFQLDSRIS